MKILSGRFRGRKLAASANGTFRPTSDKVRQAVFDSLRGRLEGKNVLDLYAGSGAIAMEALSNGASLVCCVEIDKKRCRQIRETVQSADLPDSSCITHQKDVSDSIRQLRPYKDPFFLIYIDPPYEDPIKIADIQYLAESNLLDPDGKLIIETKTKNASIYKTGIDFMKLLKERKFGGTTLLEYQLK